MKAHIEYLPDESIDAATDQQIRDLLTTCFTGPQDAVFQHRRYFIEPYPNRWVIRDAEGTIIAHVGVHEKTVKSDERTYRIGGIAEVSVHPDHRGQGHVRHILAEVHPWLVERGFDFAVLFGNPDVYSSSGYSYVPNLYQREGDDPWKPVEAMMRPLTDESWPSGKVYLEGPKF